MCIASLQRSALACIFAGVLLHPGTVVAHPVAQGALDVGVFPNRVVVRAAVSGEEILVAAAFHAGNPLAPGDAARVHGDYLLRHLRISVDAQALNGRVADISPGDSGGAVYEINYPIQSSQPVRLPVEQDVLREVEFAPGNPWEATDVVHANLNGQAVAE